MNSIRYWNKVALDLVAGDYTPTVTPKPDQGGPTRTARALAMIHLGMYEIVAQFPPAPFASYLAPRIAPDLVPAPPTGSSREAAIGACAATLCRFLYSAQTAAIEAAAIAFAPTLAGVGIQSLIDGEIYGHAIAQRVIAQRAGDKSDFSDSYAYGVCPGMHRPDPHHPGQQVLGPRWGEVKPFAIASGQATVITPPLLTDPRYTKHYKQVREFGSLASTHRTPEQSVTGIYWSYDGSAKLGTPPRLYNQIAAVISDDRGNTVEDDAKLFGLINAGMADAGIAAWYHKYLYQLWRPVVGVREAGSGSGPTGLGDGNPKTVGDTAWCPLGAQATNSTTGTDLTPNFPAYPSGHATFGSACFNLIALLYAGGDLTKVKFKFVSDEYNGVNRSAAGTVRPRIVREYSLAEANKDNLESRVWLGVHWLFDGEDGDVLGKAIATEVFATLT